MSKTDKVTTASLSADIVTEADAYLHLEMLRWGNCPVCANCDSQDVYLIVPKNGTSRSTGTGTMSERRVWRCRSCKKHFSVLVGTVMHATKIPVRTWVLVMFDMCASKNGISAHEISRRYGLTVQTAWHMLHRLRKGMAADDGPMFTGDVVSDETYIGGERRTGKTDKIPVVTIMESATRRVRSRAVANVTGRTLRKVIAETVDMPFATLHTDALRAYVQIGATMAGHHVVNHEAGEYANDKRDGTNKVEGFFAQLKRSVDGTHHHVSREHLQRYLDEFSFRYSTCKMSDAEAYGSPGVAG